MKIDAPSIESEVAYFSTTDINGVNRAIENMLRTGNYRVDQDHKRIAEMMFVFVHFIEKTVKKSTKDKILALYKIQKKFDKLFKQVVLHFEIEERLMKQHNHPNFVEHKNGHELFLDDLEELEEIILDESFNIDWEHVKSKLLEMLYSHIKNDIELQRYLQ